MVTPCHDNARVRPKYAVIRCRSAVAQCRRNATVRQGHDQRWARLAGDLAPWFVVLGYNFFILIAGTGYLLGITQSKEYSEPEWYADPWLTIVWVISPGLLGTIMRRKELHIYVANWFYLAFIVTIAVLAVCAWR